jgi:hypothetical protein
MSNQNLTVGQRVAIGRKHWDVPVRVALQPYLRFSHRLDGQLRRLVASWAYTAAPCARGVPRKHGSRTEGRYRT